jgi:hypothetical protein
MWLGATMQIKSVKILLTLYTIYIWYKTGTYYDFMPYRPAIMSMTPTMTLMP